MREMRGGGQIRKQINTFESREDVASSLYAFLEELEDSVAEEVSAV